MLKLADSLAQYTILKNNTSDNLLIGFDQAEVVHKCYDEVTKWQMIIFCLSEHHLFKDCKPFTNLYCECKNRQILVYNMNTHVAKILQRCISVFPITVFWEQVPKSCYSLIPWSLNAEISTYLVLPPLLYASDSDPHVTLVLTVP